MEPTPKSEAPTGTAPKKKGRGMMMAIAAIVIIIIIVAAVYWYMMPSGTTANVSIFDAGASNPCPNATACGYTPANYTAKVNVAVVWKNNGGADHTATTNSTLNGSLPPYDSGSISAGGTVSHSFSTAGQYHYYCTIHPSMKAIVTVTN